MLDVKPAHPTCPAFDGIYFPSDHTVIPIAGGPATGYELGTRQPIDAIVPLDRLDWSPDLEATDTCRLETPELLVVGGAGSYEGEGFLAAFSGPEREGLWLLYSQTSEGFRRVALSGDDLVAISADPPYLYEWRVPLRSPESFRVHRIP